MKRLLGGATVWFEAGASITKVSLPSDYSTIHISQLPQDSTPSSVTTLLRSHGLASPNSDDIRIIRGPGAQCAADIRVEDRDFARSVCDKIGPHVVSRTRPKRQPFATQIETSIVSDSNALRVNCKKVRCSWHKPCKTAWLNFGNGDIATRVSRKFREGTYRILGQVVTCNNATRGGGAYNPKAWTVCLTEVPATASKDDISRAVQFQGDKPRDIQIGKPTYSADAEECSAMIQSLFTKTGPLEWWEFTPDSTGKRMKANARFQEEHDAREAARTLNGTNLPFHASAKLTVNLVYSAKFKIAESIYEAVESQIRAKIKEWKALHLHFTVYDNSVPPKWYRVLKLEGEVAKDVAEAKLSVEKMLAGTIAMDGNTVLWHPSFLGKGVLSHRLAQLQLQTGVLIIRDKAKSQLRLYGPTKVCDKVQANIIQILTSDTKEVFSLLLDQTKLSWACRGGFKQTAEEIGNANVTFDIISTPKRIIVTGTYRQYEAALALMDSQGAVRRNPSSLSTDDCTICWTEAENPIKTGCGHTYCLGCFETLCISATTSDSEVLVKCAGGSDKCATVFGVPELQEHLSSAAFEELLERSFTSYMRHNPHLVRYCPSAGCGYIYRVSDTAESQTCPNCLSPVCTGCHAQHNGMTCADYQDITTGRIAALEQLKLEDNIRDCPKCKTLIQKTDGCNHITCMCGAHICWFCLRIFERSGDCYSHMTGAHGSIGIAVYE